MTLIQNFYVIQNTRKQIKWQATDWEKNISNTWNREKVHFFFFVMQKQLLNLSKEFKQREKHKHVCEHAKIPGSTYNEQSATGKMYVTI